MFFFIFFNIVFFQVFPNELESQPEFEGFSEWLQTFDLYRGKKSEEEFEDENRIVGKFKVNLLHFYDLFFRSFQFVLPKSFVLCVPIKFERQMPTVDFIFST